MDTMNRLSILPADYEGKVKVQEWYVVTVCDENQILVGIVHQSLT